jgi:hypothetical protein
VVLRGYLSGHNINGRDVWVAGASDAGRVKDLFASYDLLDDRVHIVEGDPSGALTDGAVDPIALLHVGAGAAVGAVLESLYPRLAPDAAVLVDGASNAEVRAALDAFRSAHEITDAETGAGGTTSWRRGKSFNPAPGAASVKAAAAAGQERRSKVGSLLKRGKQG